MKDKIKAVALFSGGLDSILAVKLIQEQGIEVKGINFKTPFFGLGEAFVIAKDLDIPTPFLGKILQNLAKHKILSSTKGPHGGFTLRMKADKTADALRNFYDIIFNQLIK